MNELKQKWQQLESRERQLVSALAAVFAVALFYFAIWSPLQSGVDAAKQRVASQQRNLTWMQESATKIIQSKGQSKTSARKVSGSLSQRVNRTASQHGIKLSRIQPQKNDLSVRIDSVDFNKLLAWVKSMEQQGIQVVSVDLSKEDQPGLTEVRKLLLRSAS